jgi:hypothetical protein
MPASRARRFVPLAAVLCLAALVGVAALVWPRPDRPSAPPPRPRLAVLIVFDQMRGDFIDRWRPLFGEGGFRRLQDDGAWFVDCHYPYATTTTGPGHASVLAGCSAERHGIVNNDWYDAQAGEAVYCATEPRYDRVPALLRAEEPAEGAEGPAGGKGTVGKKKQVGSGSPGRLLSPTVGDALKDATGGKGRVIGLSLKDRSAILPVGRRPDGAYWFDTASGSFVTSTYYRDSLPAWLGEFNKGRPADRWFGHDWVRLRTDLDYEKFSGPDDVPGEGKGVGRLGGVYQGRTFPHPMTGGLGKPGRNYYEAVTTSPFGNDLLLDLVKRAVEAENLGRHEAPDLLTVSFSSNDLIGHVWGPDSQEVLDVTLRSDLVVRDLLAFLDEKVGAGQYLVALTADHGICPLPEVESHKSHPQARRVAVAKLVAGAEKSLAEQFGTAADAKAHWLEHASPPWLYVNRRLAAEHGRSAAEVAQALAGWLAKQPGIARAYTRAQLEGPAPADDPLFVPMRRSYHPARCGDVGVVLEEYCLLGTGIIDTGTMHGTPYDYDTHVPLLVYGPGVRPGRRPERVTPQATAAVFAEAMGIPRPRDAEAPVPEGLFK